MIKWIKKLLFKSQVEELAQIEKALNEQIKTVIYYPIRSFQGINAQYYSWINELINREEYRYLLFDLRENVLREMALNNDKEKLCRFMGRLDMLNVIDNYLKKYKVEYEDSIRRNSENAKK